MARRRSLSRQFRNFTIIMLVGVGVFLAWYLLRQQAHFFDDSDEETSFTLYPGFGIPVPDGYAIHGIDVSRYQKRVNWALVKGMKDRDLRIGFAFIKATEGESLVDPYFARNWRKAREARLHRGAYHFFRYGVPAESQASHFIRNVTLLPGDLPPVLDVEIYQGTDIAALQDEVARWLALVEQHYQVKPLLYTNASFYNRNLHPRFNDYPLWVAHYFEQRQPRVKRDWQFWQHNEGGRVNGINAFVDFNVFNGDSTDFRKLLIP